MSMTYHSDPGWLQPETRFRILHRQGFKCFYCEEPVNHPRVRMDHLYPKSQGGPHGHENRVAACIPCDTRKRNRLPYAHEIAKQTEILLREQRILSFGVAIRLRLEEYQSSKDERNPDNDHLLQR